jgi:hypothetical protein
MFQFGDHILWFPKIVKVHVGKLKNQWLTRAMQNLVLFIKQHNAYSNNK